MSLRSDYDFSTANRMEAELRQFSEDCQYDQAIKRIVYRSAQAAVQAYMAMQTHEMERHKWIESEKARHDLNRSALTEWVCRYSEAFARYWRRTHVFVPSETPADGQAESPI